MVLGDMRGDANHAGAISYTCNEGAQCGKTKRILKWEKKGFYVPVPGKNNEKSKIKNQAENPLVKVEGGGSKKVLTGVANMWRTHTTKKKNQGRGKRPSRKKRFRGLGGTLPRR